MANRWIRAEEIKVASNKKSTAKDKPAKGTTIKLKKPPPKQSKPGEWKNNNVLEGTSARAWVVVGKGGESQRALPETLCS